MNIPAAPIENALTPSSGLRALGASFLAGVGAGQRSMLPLAVQSWRTPERSTLARVLVTVLAAGELLGDKLPFAPDRRMPLALAGRAVTGGLAAFGVAPRSRARLANVLVGGTAAILATYAGAHLRRALDRRLPKPAGALAEDALTFGIAYLAARLARPAKA